MNLIKLENQDGLEFHIDEETNIAYASIKATARMLGVEPITVRRFLQGGTQTTLKTAEVQTAGGLQGGTLLSSNQVFKLAIKYNPELAKAMGSAGANLYMLGMAGYQVKVESAPLSDIEILEMALAKAKALELAEKQIGLLEEDNLRQAEVIDELFDYSSIIRIAKYNGCSEKCFSWHKLKAASQTLGLEIKKVPCPRFTEKNLYSHDAWRLAYSEYKLPDTTTLRIG